MNDKETDGIYRLGVELQNRRVNAVIVGPDGSIRLKEERRYESDEETVPRIIEFVELIEAESGNTFDVFGLALPGLVDITGNKVVYSAQMPLHEKTDIAGQIRAATGKAVFLENDANVAAFGELTGGAATEAKDCFYVHAGRGIGGALILDRQVWHGVSGFAGEFGYVAINSEGLRLEDMVAEKGVVRRAKNRLNQDPASSLFEVGEENISLDDVIEAARKQDGLAELIIERTGMFLGTAIAGVINLLNIEKVIVGGELMSTGDLILDAIRKRARELSFEPAFLAVSIEAGELGEYAGSYGAAMLAQNRK